MLSFKRRVKNKILIIGASSGIGREIALLYARSGHRVAITGRRVDLLQQTRDHYPDAIIFAWLLQMLPNVIYDRI